MGTGFLPLSAAEKIPIKVVVVTMFEVGEDSKDTPGEFQFWVERLHLDQKISAPLLFRDLRSNGKGLIALVTGMGTARSAASIMALGSDPRFDFTKAYWLVAGIAGIDPADGSIGSAVWADYVVDGDLAHEIDARKFRRLVHRLHAAFPRDSLRQTPGGKISARFINSTPDWRTGLINLPGILL